MLLWSVAILVTTIACAALYFAAGGRTANATLSASAPENRHFQLVLSDIDADAAVGLLGEGEALSAKGELAREMLRQKAEAAGHAFASWRFGRGATFAALGGVAVIALGVYAVVGSPELDSQPLAARTDIAALPVDVDQALLRIEAALKAKPEDLRGWSAVAPLYMKMQRYADAEQAFRHMIALGNQTAVTRTDLAEALLMQKQGDASGEPLALLKAASALDPADPRSRFYIAGELTRAGYYAEAVTAWTELLALAKGGEPWLATAQEGLRFAKADGAPAANATPPAQSDAIDGMVGGLAQRLNTLGGTIEEWSRLVRSYLVLGDKASAQAAYDRAVVAYPTTSDRADLDSVAAAGGLALTGLPK